MRKDYRIVGSGGQGVIMLSVILAGAYGMYEGYEVAQTQSYGPEARGGACRAELVISDEKIDYVKVRNIDVLVAFNEVGFKKYAENLSSDTIIFADSTFIDKKLLESYPNVYTINATQIAEEKFKPFCVNIVMLGFMASKLENLGFDSAKKAMLELLPKKALELNENALTYGYNAGK